MKLAILIMAICGSALAQEGFQTTSLTFTSPPKLEYPVSVYDGTQEVAKISTDGVVTLIGDANALRVIELMARWYAVALRSQSEGFEVERSQYKKITDICTATISDFQKYLKRDMQFHRDIANIAAPLAPPKKVKP